VDNVELNLKEVGYEDVNWIFLAEVRAIGGFF
jgi:hypothetical protein